MATSMPSGISTLMFCRLFARAPRSTSFSRPGVAAARGNGNGNLSGEIAAGERVGIGLDFGEHALGEKLAAEFAGAGTEVEQVIGGAQDVSVVLDNNDGVAQVAQLFKDMDQARSVARVQADGGLVEHVERAHEARTQRGGELNALRFAAGEGGGQAVEREVFEAHGIEEAQALADLIEDRAGNLLLHWRELQRFEKLVGVRNGERGGFADVLAMDADGASFGAQALAAAVGALCVPAILAEHDADVELVFFALHLRKEAHRRLESFPLPRSTISRGLRSGRARERRAGRRARRRVASDR